MRLHTWFVCSLVLVLVVFFRKRVKIHGDCMYCRFGFGFGRGSLFSRYNEPSRRKHPVEVKRKKERKKEKNDRINGVNIHMHGSRVV